MRLILFLSLIFLLSGCAGNYSTVTRVEIEDLYPIINETLTNMEDCIDYSNKKSCERADDLIAKHPWLVGGGIKDISLENDNGMRANEWEVESVVAKKEYRQIDNLYGLFYTTCKNMGVNQ